MAGYKRWFSTRRKPWRPGSPGEETEIPESRILEIEKLSHEVEVLRKKLAHEFGLDHVELQKDKLKTEVGLLRRELQIASRPTWRETLARYWAPALIAASALYLVTTLHQLSYWREQKLFESRITCTNKRVSIFSDTSLHVLQYVSAQTNKKIADCEARIIGRILVAREKGSQVDKAKSLECLVDTGLDRDEAETRFNELLEMEKGDLQRLKNTYEEQSIEHRRVRQQMVPLIYKDISEATLFFGARTKENALALRSIFEKIRGHPLTMAHLQEVRAQYDKYSEAMSGDLRDSFQIPAPGCSGFAEES